MEETDCRQLVDGLSKRIMFSDENRNAFIRALSSTFINPDSTKFYVESPYDETQQCPIEEYRKYHYLSIRGILINKNAEWNVSLVKKVWNVFVNRINWFSKAYSRELGINKQIARILKKSAYPFSLLVKMQTFDYNNPEETLFIITKTILIVPNASQEDLETITDWEWKKERYEKEVGVFRQLRKSSSKEYLSSQALLTEIKSNNI